MAGIYRQTPLPDVALLGLTSEAAILGRKHRGHTVKAIPYLLLFLIIGCGGEPQPTRMEDLNLAKLEGLETRCAKAAAGAAYDSVEVSKLMSIGGATETIGAISNAIESEIQRCVLDVYLMGVEDGRELEREVN